MLTKTKREKVKALLKVQFLYSQLVPFNGAKFANLFSFNQMNIKVFTRSNWGNTHTYILDDNINDAVMTLTKKKTIDRYDIRALEALGHTIEIVLDPSLSVDRATLVA